MSANSEDSNALKRVEDMSSDEFAAHFEAVSRGEVDPFDEEPNRGNGADHAEGADAALSADSVVPLGGQRIDVPPMRRSSVPRWKLLANFKQLPAETKDQFLALPEPERSLAVTLVDWWSADELGAPWDDAGALPDMAENVTPHEAFVGRVLMIFKTGVGGVGSTPKDGGIDPDNALVKPLAAAVRARLEHDPFRTDVGRTAEVRRAVAKLKPAKAKDAAPISDGAIARPKPTPEQLEHRPAPTGLADGPRKREPPADDGSEDESAKKPARVEIVAKPYIWRPSRFVPRRDHIYGTEFTRKFVTITIGPGGEGKSSFTLVEDIACATGKNLIGVMPRKLMRVWNYNLEDPADEIELKVLGIMQHYGLTEADLGDRLFFNSGRDQELVIAKQGRNGIIIMEPVVDALVEAMRENKIDKLTIDPFISSHSVPENDNSSVGAVLKKWAYIASETNASIGLVHHSKKTGGLAVTAEDGRGASAGNNAARAVRTVNKMSKDEGARLGIDNPWRYFRVDGGGKHTHAADPSLANWFRFHDVPLDNGEPGAPEWDVYRGATRIGVPARWTPESPLVRVTTTHLDQVRERVRQQPCHYRKSPKAEDWIGKMAAEVMNLDLAKASDKATVNAALDAWFRSGALGEEEGKDKAYTKRKFVTAPAYPDEDPTVPNGGPLDD